MRRLFFKLYHAGLNNCRMSLDIGVGLAHLTGRTLAPYNVQPPWSSHPLLRRGTDYSDPATILDLFDLPVPIDRACAGESEIVLPGVRSLLQAPVYESVLWVEPAPPIEGDDFQAFRNRREHVAILANEVNEDTDFLVDVPTLGMYSYFFYGDVNTQSDLRRILGQVRARQPYTDFADRVARSLIPFNAVHIRRGDFLHPESPSQRSNQVTGEEVTNNLASRLSVNDRLVVCTDTSRDDWFAPLRGRFRDIVLLDQLLLESESWRAEFEALPYHDDVVLGLVTQLVAAQAEHFVGTLYSSFSAIIQRLRGFEGRKPEFLYCYSEWEPGLVPFERCEFPPVQEGPYSWNRIIYPVDPCAVSWLRDWPESFQEPPAAPLDAVPSQTIFLRASEARVHGLVARYERSFVHDNIGYWTNPDDFVTWNLFVPERAVYRVEIRYACPDAHAGSTFMIGLGQDNQDKQDKLVAGTVLGTGGWLTFSSWHVLGSLEIPAGQNALFIRVLTMSSAAVMNLAGVRLVPIQG
jgi:GDP-fucose protein O-fucosyltransferase